MVTKNIGKGLSLGPNTDYTIHRWPLKRNKLKFGNDFSHNKEMSKAKNRSKLILALVLCAKYEDQFLNTFSLL